MTPPSAAAATRNFFTVGSGSLEPGAGVDKILGSAGDLFITGIVAPTGPLPQLNLQTVRLSLVMRFAECIAGAVASLTLEKEAACEKLSL